MKSWNGHDQFAYSHAKRDGWNILVEIRGSGVHYWTSGWQKKDLSFLPVHRSVIALPVGTTLHCELWKPDTHATSIASVIADGDVDGKLEVFGIEGLGLGASSGLDECQEACELAGLQYIPFVEGMASHREILEHAEGWVYKNGNMTQGWKFKPFKDATLRVTGFEWGKGKYTGMVGSLEVALDDGTVVANISGMNDQERAMFTAMLGQGVLVGMLVDVSYQKVNSKGKLRHANFLRTRLDKSSADKEFV